MQLRPTKVTNQMFEKLYYIILILDNSVYSLDPITKQWRRHSSSTSFRYLHSAVASHGLMIVFGGNTHNDTSTSHGAKCFSADVLAYDMVCDKVSLTSLNRL